MWTNNDLGVWHYIIILRSTSLAVSLFFPLYHPLMRGLHWTLCELVNLIYTVTKVPVQQKHVGVTVLFYWSCYITVKIQHLNYSHSKIRQDYGYFLNAEQQRWKKQLDRSGLKADHHCFYRTNLQIKILSSFTLLTLYTKVVCVWVCVTLFVCVCVCVLRGIGSEHSFLRAEKICDYDRQLIGKYFL